MAEHVPGTSIGNRAPTQRVAPLEFPTTRTSPGLIVSPVVRSSERNIGWQLDLEARGGMGIYRKSI